MGAKPLEIEAWVYGWYRPNPGPYGLPLKIAYYNRRNLPEHILNTINANKNKIDVQILVDVIGGQEWINAHTSELEKREW